MRLFEIQQTSPRHVNASNDILIEKEQSRFDAAIRAAMLTYLRLGVDKNMELAIRKTLRNAGIDVDEQLIDDLLITAHQRLMGAA